MIRPRRLLASTILMALPLLFGGCHRPDAGAVLSGESNANFQGRILCNGKPVGKAVLFLRPLSGSSRREIELMTRIDGRFETALPPGRYALRSSPTTMCPVRGTITLSPGVNRYRLVVHALSFLTCKPGEIRRL